MIDILIYTRVKLPFSEKGALGISMVAL